MHNLLNHPQPGKPLSSPLSIFTSNGLVRFAENSRRLQERAGMAGLAGGIAWEREIRERGAG
ncbi:MAG TPA: hypothetical protein VD772_13060 [Anseongella sp.]|nr:hypothetical protein [Anseongella sp.]